MITKLKLVAIALLLPLLSYSQYFYQGFDGFDSSAFALFTTIDTSYTANIWQVGPPQKVIFDNSWTAPNVLVTDTINTYPTNNRSQFQFTVPPDLFGWSVLAIQWNQKLDMESGKDGGIIEYSIDSGATWTNVFNDPYTYNFYGFDTLNQDTLTTGEYAFSGVDSTWKSIWLCFDNNFLFLLTGELTVRFTFHSDSVDTQQEGWMIDQFYVQQTIVHTVKKTETDAQPYLKVYPTATTGRVYIEAEKLQEFHIIESIELISTDGKIVKTWGTSPTKFYIDIDEQTNGMYYLKVKTNKKIETIPIVLNR
jgi:hypothetical protein